MLRLSSWTILGLSISALAGCGGGGGETEEAHEAAAQYAGPIGSSDVARGQEVYSAVCSACHDGGAPQLANIGWDAGRMRQQVREGEDRMPPISEARVSADDLEAVLAYLTTIGAVTDPLPAGGEPTPATEGGEAPVEGATDDAGEADDADTTEEEAFE